MVIHDPRRGSEAEQMLAMIHSLPSVRTPILAQPSLQSLCVDNSNKNNNNNDDNNTVRLTLPSLSALSSLASVPLSALSVSSSPRPASSHTRSLCANNVPTAIWISCIFALLHPVRDLLHSCYLVNHAWQLMVSHPSSAPHWYCCPHGCSWKCPSLGIPGSKLATLCPQWLLSFSTMQITTASCDRLSTSQSLAPFLSSRLASLTVLLHGRMFEETWLSHLTNLTQLTLETTLDWQFSLCSCLTQLKSLTLRYMAGSWHSSSDLTKKKNAVAPTLEALTIVGPFLGPNHVDFSRAETLTCLDSTNATLHSLERASMLHSLSMRASRAFPMFVSEDAKVTCTQWKFT